MTALTPVPRPIDKDLWVVDHLASLPLGVRMPLCATIVRLADGGLWIHSPTPLSPELATAVEALGPVRDLVAPNRFHHLSAGAWAQRFPGARLWAAPGLPEKRRELSFAGVLGDGATAPWANELAALPLAGAPAMNEVVFFHPASRTLVCTDLLFNVRKPASAMTSFILTLVGTKGRFAMSRLWWRYARDRAALKASIEKMLEWDFARVIPSHGEIYESGSANGDTRAALAWMLR
jgi:glyoxylase-like metal-dependent hydrolase (beta-lactamase superfamily II)